MVSEGKPKTTWHVRRWQLRRFANSHPRGPLSVGAADCANWLSQPAHRNWSAATKYSEAATLRAFFGWLQDRGERCDNPALKLRGPKVVPIPRPPAPEDLPPVARRDVALAIELSMRLGLRRAELAQVHRRDVKRASDGWTLVVHGKGAKDRVLPLPDDLAGQLIGFRSWVFPSPATNSETGHVTPSTMGKWISEAMPEGFSAHSCRRRFGRKAFQGGDLRAVQILLGHSSPAVTQVYLFVDQPALRRAVDYASRQGAA